MKNKIITLLLIFAAFSSNIFAFKVVLRGGGNNSRYYQVVLTKDYVSCSGAGNNKCPVEWGSTDAASKNAHINLGELTSYVFRQIESGNKSGDVVYADKLPMRWNTLEDETLEIEIDDEFTGLEN